MSRGIAISLINPKRRNTNFVLKWAYARIFKFVFTPFQPAYGRPLTHLQHLAFENIMPKYEIAWTEYVLFKLGMVITARWSVWDIGYNKGELTCSLSELTIHYWRLNLLKLILGMQVNNCQEELPYQRSLTSSSLFS